MCLTDNKVVCISAVCYIARYLKLQLLKYLKSYWTVWADSATLVLKIVIFKQFVLSSCNWYVIYNFQSL